MKKSLFLCTVFALAVNFASAQQIPSDWDVNPPRNTAGVRYSVGVSLPSATEQEAYKGAWQNALQNFDSSIATRVESVTDISVHEEGYDSGIADTYTVTVETSSFSTQVPLAGKRKGARHQISYFFVTIQNRLTPLPSFKSRGQTPLLHSKAGSDPCFRPSTADKKPPRSLPGRPMPQPPSPLTSFTFFDFFDFAVKTLK